MAYTEYTQLKVKAKYRDKLKKLAQSQNRSMANMIEVLIDQADTPVTTAASERSNTTTEADKNALDASAAQLEGSDGK